MLREGDRAPAFELPDIESWAGEPFRLRDELESGRAVVPFFGSLAGREDALTRRLRLAVWFWGGAPVAPCMVDTGGCASTDRAAAVPCPVLPDPFGTVTGRYDALDRRALFVIGTDRRVAYAWREGDEGLPPVRGAIDALLSAAPAAWPDPAQG